MNHICQYCPLFAIISRYFPVNVTGMANMLTWQICLFAGILPTLQGIRWSPLSEFDCSSFVVVDMLPNLPAKEDKTKNSSARIFEDWCGTVFHIHNN